MKSIKVQVELYETQLCALLELQELIAEHNHHNLTLSEILQSIIQCYADEDMIDDIEMRIGSFIERDEVDETIGLSYQEFDELTKAFDEAQRSLRKYLSLKKRLVNCGEEEVEDAE